MLFHDRMHQGLWSTRSAYNPGWMLTVAHGTPTSPAGSNHGYADGSVRWQPFKSFNRSAVALSNLDSGNGQVVPFRSDGALNWGGYPTSWSGKQVPFATGEYVTFWGMANNGSSDKAHVWNYKPWRPPWAAGGGCGAGACQRVELTLLPPKQKATELKSLWLDIPLEVRQRMDLTMHRARRRLAVGAAVFVLAVAHRTLPGSYRHFCQRSVTDRETCTGSSESE